MNFKISLTKDYIVLSILQLVCIGTAMITFFHYAVMKHYKQELFLVTITFIVLGGITTYLKSKFKKHDDHG